MLYPQVRPTGVVITIKKELHSAILNGSSAAGVIEVELACREAVFKELTAGQRHGARAALAGLPSV